MMPIVAVTPLAATMRVRDARTVAADANGGGNQRNQYERDFAAAKAVEDAMTPFTMPAQHVPRTASDAEFAEYLMYVTGDGGAVLRALSKEVQPLYTPSTAAVAMKECYVDKPEPRRYK